VKSYGDRYSDCANAQDTQEDCTFNLLSVVIAIAHLSPSSTESLVATHIITPQRLVPTVKAVSSWSALQNVVICAQDASTIATFKAVVAHFASIVPLVSSIQFLSSTAHISISQLFSVTQSGIDTCSAFFVGSITVGKIVASFGLLASPFTKALLTISSIVCF